MRRPVKYLGSVVEREGARALDIVVSSFAE